MHVIIDEVSRGNLRRGIRRPVLVDRHSGLLCELPTTYIYRKMAMQSLNTQIAALYDLAFFREWCRLRQLRSARWIAPEIRVREGLLAITAKEVDQFGTWCQSSARALTRAAAYATADVSSIPEASAVSSCTTNRRLHTVLSYLIWLTKDQVQGTLSLEDSNLAKSENFVASLQASFNDTFVAGKSATPPRSLPSEVAAAIRDGISSLSIFPDSSSGNRDRLIARVLDEAGLRAGELLKLQCTDVIDHYEISPNKYVGVLKVLRRPNDCADPRTKEPAVKTLPGPVHISKALAVELVRYVLGDRRRAVSSCKAVQDSPYLFVSHTGPYIGQPISQRNLNRIVAKLRTAAPGAASLSPHMMRHTHFTELKEAMSAAGVQDLDAERIMQQRGHWSPNSGMPSHYTQRQTARDQAKYAEEREKMLATRK